VQLKWPNDLVSQQKKLAGILIEMRGETGGPARVVIGIGLNLRLPAKTRLTLAEQQAALVTDLHELLGERTPTRNALVAAMIDELIASLRQFARTGFAEFSAAWSARDALANLPVRVLAANEEIVGVSRGVAADGALLVDVNGEMRRFMSGDVSLRAALP
jgi:BirA family biotin operon repressor/biotin-[acetyl-CoA-carboxylase] ligase